LLLLCKCCCSMYGCNGKSPEKRADGLFRVVHGWQSPDGQHDAHDGFGRPQKFRDQAGGRLFLRVIIHSLSGVLRTTHSRRSEHNRARGHPRFAHDAIFACPNALRHSRMTALVKRLFYAFGLLLLLLPCEAVGVATRQSSVMR
jgi:hypothetical protein